MGDDRLAITDIGDSLDQTEMGPTSNASISKQDPRKIARGYQLELSRKALEENMIVVLETGCGKTLIAILLMSYMDHLIKKPQKQLCVFLAPTVLLVHQQAEVIEQFTDFKVGIYYGDAKHLKTHSAWQKEVEQYELRFWVLGRDSRRRCFDAMRFWLLFGASSWNGMGEFSPIPLPCPLTFFGTRSPSVLLCGPTLMGPLRITLPCKSNIIGLTRNLITS